MKTEILRFTQDDTLDAACHSEWNVVQRRIWVLCYPRRFAAQFEAWKLVAASGFFCAQAKIIPGSFQGVIQVKVKV